VRSSVARDLCWATVIAEAAPAKGSYPGYTLSTIY